MNAMRDLLAFLLAVVAAVALGLWAPAAWVQHNVVDERGFLAVAQPLSGNQQFQDDVADTAVDGVLQQVHVPRLAKDLFKPTLTAQAEKLTKTDAFSSIWGSSMKDLHTTLMNPKGGTVRADLNPYVEDLLQPVEKTLGISVDVPDSSALNLQLVEIPASPWPERLTTFASMAPWIGWAGIGAGVLALVIGRHRGAVALILGAGLAVAGLALLVVTQNVGALVPSAVEQAPILGALVQAFETRLGNDMTLPSTELMGAGVLLVVLALVAFGAGAARRGRR